METEEKFITTVDLTIPHIDNVYQFLYASQLYGTLFGIYGRFDCKKESADNCSVRNINFRLINYKGCVNIGFEKIELKEKDKDRDDKLTINLHVKPLVKMDDMNLDRPFSIANNTEIIVQRWVIPYDSKLVTNPENKKGERSRDSIFFDTEFNFRDGYYEVGAPERAGQVGVRLGIASPRCHESNVKIKF